MNKLLLVDGHNLLFQMFYGMPARIVNHEGRAIQGTLGFVGALLKIIRIVQPTHIAVLFDGEHENDRTELDAAYKANRPDWSAMPEEETPFSQLPDIYAALDCMGIAHTEIDDYETDDAIASFTFEYGMQNEIVIASQDSDFFQLITDRVTVLRYRGEQSVLCDVAYLQNKLGILPSQYAAWKALVGDSADHIRGIPKIGPKTATALLKQYGTLEKLLSKAESISKPSIRQTILEHTEQITHNLALICLSARARIPFSMQDMVYRGTGLSTTEVLRKIGVQK